MEGQPPAWHGMGGRLGDSEQGLRHASCSSSGPSVKQRTRTGLAATAAVVGVLVTDSHSSGCLSPCGNWSGPSCTSGLSIRKLRKDDWVTSPGLSPWCTTCALQAAAAGKQ